MQDYRNLKGRSNMTKLGLLFEEDKIDAVNQAVNQAIAQADKHVRKEIARKMFSLGDHIIKVMIVTRLTRAEIDRIFDTQVSQLYELIPGFGRDLAGDGKYIDSVAKGKPKEGQSATDNRSENDAQWSKKEYHWTDSSGKKQTTTEVMLMA